MGETYIYSVSSVVGTDESEPSPELRYTHGDTYCGDGLKQR